MTRAAKFLAIPFSFLLFGSFANAAGAADPQKEAKLVGAWQEGLTSQLAAGDGEQLRRAKSAGLLGAVVQYNADHTFVMYAPCGPKKNDLRKAEVMAIKGTWELSATDELISNVSANGRSLKIENKLTLER